MTTYFDLWDIDTGTSLGTYDTLAEVVPIALDLIRANGSVYADDLEIGYRDEMGTRRVLLDGKRLLWLMTHTPIPDEELSVAGVEVGTGPRDPGQPVKGFAVVIGTELDTAINYPRMAGTVVGETSSRYVR